MLRRLGLALLAAAVAWAASLSAAVMGAGMQPLARIAVERARNAIDGGGASIRASPHLLGTKGEDTAWVTVDFALPSASDGDWIGVFSPSNFSAPTCPGAHGSGQGPAICSAPIKYKLANYSSSGYAKSGKGRVEFLLINQRQDFAFSLFTGGLSNATLVAASNKIAFANPKAPVYARLAIGRTWNEMTVTWTSGYGISEAHPFVEWGMERTSPPERTWAGTSTFDRQSLCGEPARTIGWRDPGFIHTAFLTDLRPNKEYFYKIGHRLPNGEVVWGKSYSFTAPPYPGQKSLQRVVIFGDMGKAERDGSNEHQNFQPASLSTSDMIAKDLENIDMVFHIGDISYADGYLSQWDQFTQQVEPITSRVPYMIASGNHERDWPDSGSFYNGTDSGGECGVLAETMYYTPTESKANSWYSADYGMFRFCVADSERDWRQGTEQHEFIERCFATVDREKQPWLVFMSHRVLGYSSGLMYGKAFAEPMARQSLERLWQRHRVDVAFYGHVHGYERTCPVHAEQCVDSAENNGTVHVVVGGGGTHLSNFTAGVPLWSVYREMDFGFVKLTASDHKLLRCEYKRSGDGKVYDSFTLSKE